MSGTQVVQVFFQLMAPYPGQVQVLHRFLSAECSAWGCLQRHRGLHAFTSKPGILIFDQSYYLVLLVLLYPTYN